MSILDSIGGEVPRLKDEVSNWLEFVVVVVVVGIVGFVARAMKPTVRNLVMQCFREVNRL